MKTKELKKVLIALDYDQSAKKVSEMGFVLARSLVAEVVLLHILTDPVFYASAEYSPIVGFTGNLENVPLDLNSEEGLEKATQQFLDHFKQTFSGHSIETVVRKGDFAETILKTAREFQVDIIVMGSHSKRWLENIVLGSVSESVLNKTTLPIFFVPTKK